MRHPVFVTALALLGTLFLVAAGCGDWLERPARSVTTRDTTSLTERLLDNIPTPAPTALQAPSSSSPAPAQPINPPGPIPTAFPAAAPTSMPTARTATFELVPVADVAEKVRPAVAFIAVRQVAMGSFFQVVPQSGVGSGVLFDDAGHIITNNHVVADARDIKVTLPDGRTFGAKLVGTDPRTDLAVIRIDGKDLPKAPLGDSDRLRIGEWVVAIGNALGLEGGPTVTVGVVGALNRSITESNGETLESLIQTDAAINPGNSGGPLINMNGQVVGINTAIASEAQGIGFAIGINAVKPIVEELVARGKVIRPYLGLQTVAVTAALAARYDLAVREGLLIAVVERGSAAAKAGVQQGDVLAAMDGEQLKAQRDLRAQLGKRKPGDAVRLSLVRGSRQLTLTAILLESP